jgi:hypothetical protein
VNSSECATCRQPGSLHAGPAGSPPPDRPDRAAGIGRIGHESGDKPRWHVFLQFGEPGAQRGDYGARRLTFRLADLGQQRIGLWSGHALQCDVRFVFGQPGTQVRDFGLRRRPGGPLADKAALKHEASSTKIGIILCILPRALVGLGNP